MSILSINDLNSFTEAAIALFNEESARHTLAVHKEPTKTIVSANADEYNGYGYSAPENYTFVQNSGIYNVVVVSPKDSFGTSQFEPIGISIIKGNKLIKVKEDCKNYISNGKNILFVLDGQDFNTISTEMPRNYGGLVYWYYMLERTT